MKNFCYDLDMSSLKEEEYFQNGNKNFKDYL